MKRLSALIISLVLTTALLAACGAPNTSAPSTQNTTSTETAAASGGATGATGATTEATMAAGMTMEATTEATGGATTEATTEATGAATTEATSGATTSATTASAGGAGAGGGIIKIWSSLPRQGASKGQTDAVVNAIKMRLEEAGNKVCNGQFTIQYEDKDDATAAAGKWDPAAETANAQAAVADPDVMVYIGTFNSGAAKLSMPILNQANLVMISPANTYTGLTQKAETGEPEKYFPTGKRNYTRVVTNDLVQGKAAAQWAADLGAKTVFILDDQEVYGVGVADVFEKTATELGVQKVDRQGIDPKASDYRALATTIASKNPDLVYFGGIVDNNPAQLLKDLRSVGYKGKFLGPDGIQTDSMISGAGEAAEGMLATIPGLPQEQLGPAGKDYVQKYQAKYGQAPESYGVFGYDAAGAALQALNQACVKDRAKIRDAVFAIKDFDGALGKWSFDENGDTTLASVVGYESKGGKWVPVNFFLNGAWKAIK
jgi:branched-chain amino acid transport system substrate-binding protein